MKVITECRPTENILSSSFLQCVCVCVCVCVYVQTCVVYVSMDECMHDFEMCVYMFVKYVCMNVCIVM